MSTLDEGRTDDSLRLRAFGFDDIHPLWGGRALWATDDLSAEVKVADCTARETEFRFSLTAEEWSEIEVLVARSGLLDVQLPQRNGVPDEGRPVIRLLTASSETIVKWKWANDAVPPFDTVLERLVSLTERRS